MIGREFSRRGAGSIPTSAWGVVTDKVEPSARVHLLVDECAGTEPLVVLDLLRLAEAVQQRVDIGHNRVVVLDQRGSRVIHRHPDPHVDRFGGPRDRVLVEAPQPPFRVRRPGHGLDRCERGGERFQSFLTEAMPLGQLAGAPRPFHLHTSSCVP